MSYRFLKVTTCCFVDSTANLLLSLSEFYEVVTF